MKPQLLCNIQKQQSADRKLGYIYIFWHHYLKKKKVSLNVSSLSRTCFVSGVHLICGSIFHNVFIYIHVCLLLTIAKHPNTENKLHDGNIERKCQILFLYVCV